jgi:hypothetical protein
MKKSAVSGQGRFQTRRLIAGVLRELRARRTIVVALKETIRLMKEIDAAIPAWPID